MVHNMNKLMNIPKEFYIPISIVIASVVIAGTLFYVGGGVETNSSTGSFATETAPLKNPVAFTITDDDHIRGNPSAQVTIVEFSDLQCPYCQRFHPTVQQALDEYGDKVRWVYKHFPVLSQGIPAAEASECVWEQKGDDGFWQFIDAVFANQGRIGSPLYRELAREIGVNVAQFDTCVSERKYKDKVQADLTLGKQSGVTGTPGSFVNGQPVRGAIPYEQLKSIIDSQLQ